MYMYALTMLSARSPLVHIARIIENYNAHHYQISDLHSIVNMLRRDHSVAVDLIKIIFGVYIT